MGVLEKFGVEMIGAKREAIDMAEDRKLFREAMDRLGIENPRRPSPHTHGRGAGRRSRRRPARDHPPAFTLGGTGGGVAYNREDYERSASAGWMPRRSARS